MCGIAGYIDLSGNAVSARGLYAMAQAIRHRGPDDEGYVLIDRARGVHRAYAGRQSPDRVRGDLPMIEREAGEFRGDLALAHRRFSIMDTSPAGHQPFFAADGSCCAVFNGEIYNYLELGEELKASGVRLRSRCDTEVLLEAYRLWGDRCFARFNGFWALALYDFRTRRLILSRDRLGKRPLYWTRRGPRIYFASEIKALLTVPEIARSKAVNPEAVWHWCVDGRRDLDGTTFFDGIRNLEAATWAVVDERFPQSRQRYWQLPPQRLREADLSVEQAAQWVRETLADAVRLRLRADVPLGFELSGGVDSSTIVALAAEQSDRPITTYTVRFADPHWNEEPFARAVATRFGTDYRVIDPPLDTFWSGITAFTALQEEPYHSPNLRTSQAIWSAMRAEGTKVTLTGSAGDELFAGYAQYYWKAQLENLATGHWLRFVDNAAHWTEGRHQWRQLGREVVRAFGVRRAARYARRLAGAGEDYLTRVPYPSRQHHAGRYSRWQQSEITNTLIPYWLMSGDKTLMGVPFEGRCPFLDYRMVELAVRLPVGYLLRHGWHKWILRKAMEGYIPNDILWRRVKMGFPYPYESFFSTNRPILDLLLREARNPFIDVRRTESLREDWKAISFLLWYEYHFNENQDLFRRIERLASRKSPEEMGFRPAFLADGVVRQAAAV